MGQLSFFLQSPSLLGEKAGFTLASLAHYRFEIFFDMPIWRVTPLFTPIPSQLLGAAGRGIGGGKKSPSISDTSDRGRARNGSGCHQPSSEFSDSKEKGRGGGGFEALQKCFLALFSPSSFSVQLPPLQPSLPPSLARLISRSLLVFYPSPLLLWLSRNAFNIHVVVVGIGMKRENWSVRGRATGP